jgi:hypothetical protein
MTTRLVTGVSAALAKIKPPLMAYDAPLEERAAFYEMVSQKAIDGLATDKDLVDILYLVHDLTFYRSTPIGKDLGRSAFVELLVAIGKLPEAHASDKEDVVIIQHCSHCGERQSAAMHGHSDPDDPSKGIEWHWVNVNYVPVRADITGS